MELERDPSVYRVFEKLQTGAPCLSFDILQDRGTATGVSADTSPLSLYLCAGTQADTTAANRLIVMKLSNVRASEPKGGADSESESSDDDDDDDENEERRPRLEIAMIPYHGTINRVRVQSVGGFPVAAVWSERGQVDLWGLQELVEAVDGPEAMANFLQRRQKEQRPLTSFTGHMAEGFALDWNPLVSGRLVTGDVRGRLHVWEPRADGTWAVDQRPLTGHSQSAEDVQWSPNEPTVFASCSVDASLRVWDIRAPHSAACMITVPNAHSSDINVISWNRVEPFLVSGGDDGAVNVWDLRQIQAGQSVATFKQHSAPITSVEWHPSDPGVFAAAGADDRVTQWDLAVERDGEGEGGGEGEPGNLPPQLLFVHEGDSDLKELHWSSRYPGVLVTTAHSGFTVFRTISV